MVVWVFVLRKGGNEIEKQEGKSMDSAAQNIEKFKELFFRCFSEGKVDFEV